MKKSVIVILLIIWATVMSFAFRKQDKPKYENLKVLSKNTTKQEMDSIMKHFSASLGVKCNFCHVRKNDGQNNFDFASDENKHKGEARSMFKMMNRINKKYFKDEKDEKGLAVTCYSCHHGAENPATRPPAPAPRTPTQQSQSPTPAK
jgi:cytochrome c2